MLMLTKNELYRNENTLFTIETPHACTLWQKGFINMYFIEL